MKKSLLLLLGLFTSLFYAQEIGIVGPAANGWPNDSNPTPDIMLTNNGDGTYSIAALTLSTGPAKFRQDQSWDVNYGGSTFPSGSINGNDIPVQAGVYDIVLDLNENTYTFTDVGTFEEITVSGSALENPIVLSTANGDFYEAPVNQFMDGTVIFTTSNGDVYGVNEDTPANTLVLDGSPIQIGAGFYEIELFFNNFNFFFNIPNIGIVGPGVSEWPGDANPTPDILMTSTDGAVYTLSSQEFINDEVKFRQNQNWNTNWGGSGFPSGSLVLNGSENIMAQAGVYDVTFDRENLSYLFVSLSTNDVAFTNLSVYPNPSKGNWFIQTGNSNVERIDIYTISGKRLQQINVKNQQEIELQTNGYDAGVYFIKIVDSKGNSKTLKLIKQ